MWGIDDGRGPAALMQAAAGDVVGWDEVRRRARRRLAVTVAMWAWIVACVVTGALLVPDGPGMEWAIPASLAAIGAGAVVAHLRHRALRRRDEGLQVQDAGGVLRDVDRMVGVWRALVGVSWFLGMAAARAALLLLALAFGEHDWLAAPAIASGLLLFGWLVRVLDGSLPRLGLLATLPQRQTSLGRSLGPRRTRQTFLDQPIGDLVRGRSVPLDEPWRDPRGLR